MQIVPQILSYFKISNTRLLALQCIYAVKKLISPIILTVFTIYQTYIFNVHQITTSDGKFNIFQARTNLGHGQKVPLRMHQSTPFQVTNSIFFWEGCISFSPYSLWEGGTHSLRHTPRPHHAFWIHPASPRISARFMPLRSLVCVSCVTRVSCCAKRLNRSRFGAYRVSKSSQREGATFGGFPAH